MEEHQVHLNLVEVVEVLQLEKRHQFQKTLEMEELDLQVQSQDHQLQEQVVAVVDQVDRVRVLHRLFQEQVELVVEEMVKCLLVLLHLVLQALQTLAVAVAVVEM